MGHEFVSHRLKIANPTPVIAIASLTFLQPNTKRSESSVRAKSASPLDNR